MNQPLISVILPTHNCSSTIGTAIKSICAQTYKNIEIIVIDDNSTDDTKTTVESAIKTDSRIAYYALPFNDPERINKRGRNINAGYLARNFGFEKAKGEYITFQDADDASFINRIEVQYNLLIKHNATHLVVDWQKFEENLLNKQFDAHTFMAHHSVHIKPQELLTLAQKTKGYLMCFPFLSEKIDFEIKRKRFIHKLFFGSLEPYPGSGNAPLFKREVTKKITFRKLSQRIWPSFSGRGADRDFNFQVAETFKNSHVFKIPLYLWRSDKQNPEYTDCLKYVID